MIFLIIKVLTICLIITIVIEYIPIVIFLQIPKKYFIAVNVLTNVLANVVVLTYDILDVKMLKIINRWQLIIVLEVLICIVEIILYYIYLKRKKVIAKDNIGEIVRVIALTILANALSITIGNVILEKITLVPKFLHKSLRLPIRVLTLSRFVYPLYSL